MLKIEYNNIETDISKFQELQSDVNRATELMIDSIKNNSSYYQIFSIDSCQKMALSCREPAHEIKSKFSDLIVIGMGGAVLNPQSLLDLCQDYDSDINIHFLHNTDPIYLKNLLKKVSLKTTAILAISNFGNTLETNSLVGVMISEYQKADIKDLGKYFYFITNLKSGILYKIAQRIGGTKILHPENISGRYSGFSNVTSFVAQIAGINIDEFFSGASYIIDDFLKNKANSSPANSAAYIYLSGLHTMVNIGYLQSFNIFLEWYSQIIAESSGKNGLGITPIRGLGPNDQHTMMQLYLDGKKEYFYSLFYVKKLHSNFRITDIQELENISSKKLLDINEVNLKATTLALMQKKLPVRQVLLDDLSAKSIGALVAHSMIEVIMLCHLLKVNPFDQPGVQLIKEEAHRLMAKISD